MLKLLSLALIAGSVLNWPGLWGPARNGSVAGRLSSAVAVDTLWSRPVSGGYSEVAIAGGRAFTLELRGADDYLVALDATTGRDAWTLRLGPTYQGHDGSDTGPIGTPAVDGNDVFAVGPHGVLVAADAASGRERWRHDLVRDFDATPPTWGFAASPLIEGALVIVPTGGEKSRGLLAFDRARGTLAWNVRLDQQPTYTSAVVAVIAGVRQILAASPKRLFAVTPADGRVLWSTALAGPAVDLANSPIVIDGDRVLVLFWEDARLLRVRRNGGKAWSVDEVWRTPRLRGAFGPVVFRDGFFYGFAGEFLTCLNAETTDVAWRERFGAGRLIAVGDHLAILGETSGELTVAQMSPRRFVPSFRVRVLEPEVRSMTGPSFSDGRLFVRNLKQIVALQPK